MRWSTVSTVYETGRSEVVFFSPVNFFLKYRLHENKRITTIISLTAKNVPIFVRPGRNTTFHREFQPPDTWEKHPSRQTERSYSDSKTIRKKRFVSAAHRNLLLKTPQPIWISAHEIASLVTRVRTTGFRRKFPSVQRFLRMYFRVFKTM